jgi:5'-deoxy-5'-methylthioadenosine phosphorylase
MNSTSPIGLIAGTGFYSLANLVGAKVETVETPFGTASVTRGTWFDLPVVFLTRHGAGHSVPPHLVNYRANVWALKQLGCEDVFAINVTGGIDLDLTPGSMVCLSDFLDFTKNRIPTFFDGTGAEGVVHVDVLEAYHPELRAELLKAANEINQPLRDGGVYVCFEGPRFESPAEIRMAAMLGGSVAGMTGVPEVTLAVEAKLRYAAISLVVNPAAGLSDEPITIEDVNRVLAESSSAVLQIVERVIQNRKAS